MIRLLSLCSLLGLAVLACSEEEYTGGPAGGAAAAAGGAAGSSTPSNEDIEVVADNAEDIAPPFIYRSEGLRDPFEPFIVAITDKKGKKGCPLCQDLSELRLVGLVTGVASPLAVVETRDGLGYFVRRSSEIGANGGRVIDIRDGRVLVRERMQDQLGRISIIDRTLTLRDKSKLAKIKSDEDEALEDEDGADAPPSATTPEVDLEEDEDEFETEEED